MSSFAKGKLVCFVVIFLWLFSCVYIDLCFFFFYYYFLLCSFSPFQHPGRAQAAVGVAARSAAELWRAKASSKCYSLFGSRASTGSVRFCSAWFAYLGRCVALVWYRCKVKPGRCGGRASLHSWCTGRTWSTQGDLASTNLPRSTKQSVKVGGGRALRSNVFTFFQRLECILAFSDPNRLWCSPLLSACVYVVWVSDSFIAKQGTSPQEVILGRKMTLVHCCGGSFPPFWYS